MVLGDHLIPREAVPGVCLGFGGVPVLLLRFRQLGGCCLGRLLCCLVALRLLLDLGIPVLCCLRRCLVAPGLLLDVGIPVLYTCLLYTSPSPRD